MFTRIRFALLAAGAMSAAPALAEGTGSTLISGSLAPLCSITAPGAQSFNPALTSAQDIGSVSYQCNFAASGATIRFWSDNGGKVVMPASAANANIAQQRAYALLFNGNALGTLGNAESGTLASVSPSISAPGVPQSSTLGMQLSAAATIAGVYSDTIRMSINP